jgi:hypothetical protein
MTARRRWRSRTLIALLVIGAGAGGWAISQARGVTHAAPATEVPTSSAAVVRTDLQTTTELPGTLGYAGTYQVTDQSQGTLTALPTPGQVIDRGQTLYEVNGIGIPLFFGPRPMWRNLQAGVSPGSDVDQLDLNLVALGYSDNGYLTPGDTFTSATTAAIDEWQTARGLPLTGTVDVGDVVYAPAALRVASLATAIGTPLQPGTVVLDATSTSRSVDVALPVAQEYLVKVGDPVPITLPNGTSTTPGTIASIAPVAISVQNSSSDNSGSGAGGSGSSSSSASTAQATVDVSVQLTDPTAAGSFDQAPVEVGIVDASVKDILAVPINALVALAGGGYGVEVLSGTQKTLLGVQTGLFANTLVQVAANGLSPGMRVEVPKS